MPRLIPALLLLFAAAALAADDQPQTAAEKLAAIQKEHKDAEAAYRKTMEALPDTPEGEKKAAEVWKAFDKGQADRFAAAVDLARGNPKTDSALAALEWVLTNPRSYYLPVGKPALELLTEHHAANPKVAKTVAWIGYYHQDNRSESFAAGRALINAVLAKNSDRTARGQAIMARAWEAGRRFAAAEYKKAPDAEKLAAEAEKAFEAVVRDYAECSRMMRDGQRTLGEEAKQELFELQHLRIGKVAPEIEADGVDGKRFKLSDHRGKVTVLNFWASWCGPCMAMVPHERELVARLKNKPFVLIGVNGDDRREKAIEVMAREKMTWPSFWNGDKGPDGSISRAWNVRGWPTVYVLDARGVIRAKNVRGKDLDAAVDVLLKEMAAVKDR